MAGISWVMISAFTTDELSRLTDLIHDFYVLLPAKGVRLEDGQLCLAMQDLENIRYARTARLRLCVNRVRTVSASYDLKELPGPMAQLIDIKYEVHTKRLLFAFVHPVKLSCVVEGLDLFFEEIAAR